MNSAFYLLIIIFSISFSQSNLIDRYHTYNDIVDSLIVWEENFENNTAPSSYYPNSGIIYQLEQIGESNEDNLPIYAVKLSYNADQELDKPKVLILGQCHAEEILGVEISMELIKRFLYPQDYLNDYQTLIGVLYNTEIWIIPTHNPEGHTVVHGWDDNGNWLQDVSYRKNKTDVNGNGIFDFNSEGYGNDLDGVDLNRNYDFNWIFGDDLHTLDGGCAANPSYISHYDYYRGSAPFSEKEIQAIRDFAIEKQFFLSIAYHSSRSGCVSERVIYPWLWDGGKASPDYSVISTLGQEIAELIPVEVGDGNYHHAASGSRRGNAHDWIYARTGCIQYLIEVATENMQPDDIELIDDTVERNIQGAYHLLKRAAGINLGEGPEKFQVTGIVSNSNTGDPIIAEVEILEMSSPALYPRLTDSFGRYRRLLYADTFTLKFSAFGYESQIIENIVPSSSSITEIDVALEALNYHNLNLSINLPTDNIENVQMIRYCNSKVDTFQLAMENSFSWPDGEYDLLFISEDIFPKKQNISLSSDLNIEINLKWYDLLFSDSFTSMDNWNIVKGGWNIDNGILLSQSELIYENYHPLGPDKIDLIQPFYLNQDTTQEVAIKLLMKNELEWGKDTLFVDFFDDDGANFNIYSNTGQNWAFHDEYIYSSIDDNNYYLSIGIAPDITLGYRGLALDQLDILYELNSGCYKGDFNHDGISNILDIVGIAGYITDSNNLTEFQKCASDINDDLYIDVLDIVGLINIILGDL